MGEYGVYLSQHAFLTTIVFAAGYVMQRIIGAKSEARRIHGRYVFWWAIGAFALGGPLGLVLGVAEPPFGVFGFAMVCLLGGWLVGTLHGAFVLGDSPPGSLSTNSKK